MKRVDPRQPCNPKLSIAYGLLSVRINIHVCQDEPREQEKKASRTRSVLKKTYHPIGRFIKDEVARSLRVELMERVDMEEKDV